jgi:hypothetical protein
MTETMAVRTGRNVQRSALRCNRNTSGFAAALPISSCKHWMRSRRRRLKRNVFEHTLPAQWGKTRAGRADLPRNESSPYLFVSGPLIGLPLTAFDSDGYGKISIVTKARSWTMFGNRSGLRECPRHGLQRGRKGQGFSNAPRRNSVLAAPMCCIGAATSAVCETIQRKRRFGGQAALFCSVSPCSLAVHQRRLLGPRYRLLALLVEARNRTGPIYSGDLAKVPCQAQ